MALSDLVDQSWISAVLTNTAPWPDFAIKCPSNVLRGLYWIFHGEALIILTAMSLPRGRTWIRWEYLRLLFLPAILHHYIRLSIDGSISLGAPLRDFWFPVFAFSRMMTAIDVCLVSNWDKTINELAPRWIVPKSQAHRFPGAEPLPFPRTLAKLYEHVSSKAEPSDKARANGHAMAMEDYGALVRIEPEWYAVPHCQGLWTWRRFLWAVDHVYTYRAGTSWVFPNEQRAMEWAHASLVRASLEPDRSPFGLPEHDAPFWPWAKFIWFILLASQQHLLTIEPPVQFYDLPLWRQVYISMFEGSAIAFAPSLAEYYIVPLLVRKRILPATALPRLMHDPARSSGITDLWGRRWHTLIRRKVTRVALILPFGQSSLGNKLMAFLVSGMMHSWLLGRWYPAPPTIWHAAAFLFVPGPVAFFVAQGVGAAIEIVLFGPPPSPDRPEARSKALARLALLWGWAAFTCRWFSAAIAYRGLHTLQAQKSMLPEGLAESYRVCKAA